MCDESNKCIERWISHFVDKGANFDPHGSGSRLAASQQEPTPLQLSSIQVSRLSSRENHGDQEEDRKMCWGRDHRAKVFIVISYWAWSTKFQSTSTHRRTRPSYAESGKNAAFFAKFNPVYFVCVVWEMKKTWDF